MRTHERLTVQARPSTPLSTSPNYTPPDAPLKSVMVDRWCDRGREIWSSQPRISPAQIVYFCGGIVTDNGVCDVRLLRILRDAGRLDAAERIARRMRIGDQTHAAERATRRMMFEVDDDYNVKDGHMILCRFSCLIA